MQGIVIVSLRVGGLLMSAGGGRMTQIQMPWGSYTSPEAQHVLAVSPARLRRALRALNLANANGGLRGVVIAPDDMPRVRQALKDTRKRSPRLRWSTQAGNFEG